MIASDLISQRPSIHPRKVLRCRAQLLLADGTGFDVRTIDITSAGMSVMSQHGIAPGSRCSLVFALPLRGALQMILAEVKIVYATVVGTEGVRIGLRFMTADLTRTHFIESLQ